jgi:HK97 gp10 family phage protein
MSLKWHGESFKAELAKANAQRLTRACIHLANAVKVNISDPSNDGETPSAPGEPPHKDTGRLRASISYEVDAQEMTGRVGTNVLYGKFLELGTEKMAARPFLRSTLMEEADAIKKILTSKGASD